MWRSLVTTRGALKIQVDLQSISQVRHYEKKKMGNLQYEKDDHAP